MEYLLRRATSWHTQVMSRFKPMRCSHFCGRSHMLQHSTHGHCSTSIENQACRSNRTSLCMNSMPSAMLLTRSSVDELPSNEFGSRSHAPRGKVELPLSPLKQVPGFSSSRSADEAVDIQCDHGSNGGGLAMYGKEHHLAQRTAGASMRCWGALRTAVKDCREAWVSHNHHAKTKFVHTLTSEKLTAKERMERGKFLERNTVDIDKVERGVRVGLIASPSDEFIAGLFATWLSGGIVVPLSLSHSKRELAYVIKDAGVSMIATTLEYLDIIVPLAEELSAKLILLPPMTPSPSEKYLAENSLMLAAGTGTVLAEPCIGFEDHQSPVRSHGLLGQLHPDHDNRSECSSSSSSRDVIAAAGGSHSGDDVTTLVDANVSNITSRMDCDSPALIIYTSGTTGQPKGVVHTHEGLSCQVQSLVKAWEWSPSDAILHCLPLHHIHGLVNALLCPVYVGARIHFLRKFDPLAVWEHWCASYPANGEQKSAKLLNPSTVFMGVPTMYAKLLQAFDQSPTHKQKEFAAAARQLRLMVSGSAACPVPLMNRWHDVTGHWLLERYGMTEFGMALSNPLRGKRQPGFVGQPLPGVEVKILQEKEKAAVSVTKSMRHSPHAASPVGELCVKSSGLFKEYWHWPEKTRETFDEEGYFKTGDTVTLVDGSYKVLGRTSVDIIKSGGYKISALEIESAFLEHPEVAECAVLGVPDPVYGEVVAAVLALKSPKHCRVSDPHFHSTHALELAEVREWASKSLASYKIPRMTRFVDFIPRNSLGKVNKKELLAQLFPEALQSS